ncbi:beta-hydroxyacyl-ACP dehydratase precursor, putative [Plasmodium malariae]|uniref:3-hydroxyacyl-[acyl-carrier-protein] dehydratase n=1 Tax=Plasmodium malariae TaxID=5858 RepID=A0A1D3SPH7_PLAMA|nr:beta-hydroxyacyl-ACP dehydratase precursor, putative [Plasmodium malariae]SCO93820.1 beta-hydroxyacyl-ACP dehydratase precursor, putative [Plasmodium malariae]
MKKRNLYFLFPSTNIFNEKNNFKNYKIANKNLSKEKICAGKETINDDDISAENISNLTSYSNYDTIDIEDIKNIIPHRYPFLLVDKVIHIQVNKKIIGVKQVSVNENFFNGHFPQKSIMPGVLQIEALAQLGGILCLKNEESQKKNNLFLFAGVDGVRWKKPVLPGDTLIMEVEQISFKPSLGVAKLRGVGYVGGNVVIKIEEMIFALSK